MTPAIRFAKDECLDLPDVMYQTRDVELTAQANKYYKQLKNQMLIETSGEQISAVNAAAGMNKLLQISGGAVYTTKTKNNIVIAKKGCHHQLTNESKKACHDWVSPNQLKGFDEKYLASEKCSQVLGILLIPLGPFVNSTSFLKINLIISAIPIVAIAR